MRRDSWRRTSPPQTKVLAPAEQAAPVICAECGNEISADGVIPLARSGPHVAVNPVMRRGVIRSRAHHDRPRLPFVVARASRRPTRRALLRAASGSGGGRRPRSFGDANAASGSRQTRTSEAPFRRVVPAGCICRRASAELPSPPTAVLSRASLAWPAAASPAIGHLPPTGCQAPGVAASLPLPALRPVGSRPAR
jgi:hypothetical protein